MIDTVLPGTTTDNPSGDIKSPYWKVFFFMKSGRTVRGCNVWDSEDDAALSARNDMDDAIERGPLCFCVGEDGSFLSYELSHFIVLPWNKK